MNPWVGGDAGEPDPAQIDLELESEAIFRSWGRKRPGLHRDVAAARSVLESLGGTQSTPTVLVTGSKGKGQTAATAAAYLSAAGFRTGLVASPGILSNLDRFSLDGMVVGVDEYNRWLWRTEDAVRRAYVEPDGYLSPTGLFTVMGHAMLQANGADVIVHEAGMGGSHDEISVFDRLAVGFTSVFPEHLDVFGPTLADVAREKFGLIRPRDIVFTVPQDSVVTDVMRSLCASRAVEPHEIPAGDFLSQNQNLGCELAKYAARVLGREPYSGTVELDRPGRGQFYVTRNGAEFCLDACIDPSGLAAAVERAEERWGEVSTVYWSVPTTKNIEGMARWLEDRSVEHFFVPLVSDHLDYDLSAETEGRLRIASRDRLLERLHPHSLLAGTITFGTSVLNEIGVTATRLFRPVRIESGDLPHI
ncbi:MULTISPECIES: folylpolyglutamate synthase/dihydrofolate synthase family protein [Micrococcaceae]|uniref:hypothetical protein n=1 Tax=unclassified Kocuria TaxID=2649579 RepID=UPI0010132DDA|nr:MULTISPECIES: hypothetical protein [unclassified Kocuria]